MPCITLETYPTINDVWTAFENSLIAASGIITYESVFVDYLYQGLLSFYEDNVQYMEIRTTLPKVTYRYSLFFSSFFHYGMMRYCYTMYNYVGLSIERNTTG